MTENVTSIKCSKNSKSNSTIINSATRAWHATYTKCTCNSTNPVHSGPAIKWIQRTGSRLLWWKTTRHRVRLQLRAYWLLQGNLHWRSRRFAERSNRDCNMGLQLPPAYTWRSSVESIIEYTYRTQLRKASCWSDYVLRRNLRTFFVIPSRIISSEILIWDRKIGRGQAGKSAYRS